MNSPTQQGNYVNVWKQTGQHDTAQYQSDHNPLVKYPSSQQLPDVSADLTSFVSNISSWTITELFDDLGLNLSSWSTDWTNFVDQVTALFGNIWDEIVDLPTQLETFLNQLIASWDAISADVIAAFLALIFGGSSSDEPLFTALLTDLGYTTSQISEATAYLQQANTNWTDFWAAFTSESVSTVDELATWLKDITTYIDTSTGAWTGALTTLSSDIQGYFANIASGGSWTGALTTLSSEIQGYFANLNSSGDYLGSLAISAITDLDSYLTNINSSGVWTGTLADLGDLEDYIANLNTSGDWTGAFTTLGTTIVTYFEDVWDWLTGSTSAPSVGTTVAATTNNENSLTAAVMGTGVGNFPRTFPFTWATPVWDDLESTVSSVVSTASTDLQKLLDGLVGDGTSGNTVDAAVAAVRQSASPSFMSQVITDAMNFLDPGTGAGAALQAHPAAAISNLLGATPASSYQIDQAYSNLANTLVGLGTTVNALVAQQGAAGQGGENYNVYFNQYSNWSQVPFNCTAVGTGNGYFEISGGNATWVVGNYGEVTTTAIYNGGQMSTDYPILRATLAGIPSYNWDSGASAPLSASNWCVLRANAASAPTSFVYAKTFWPGNGSGDLAGEIGCYVGGVQTVFETNIPLDVNFNFTIQAGSYQASNPYVFYAYSGSSLIAEVYDVGQVSQIGSGYRYWGWQSQTDASGAAAPGAASYVGCSDGAPASANGSGWYAVNNVGGATSNWAIVSGNQALPQGFYNSLVTVTPDITYSDSGSYANTAIIQYAGWYAITISILEYDPTTIHYFRPLLYVGGSLAMSGRLMYVSTTLNSEWVAQDTFTVYLSAGSTVQPGYYCEDSLSGSAICGETTGTLCYWSGARLGPWPLVPISSTV